jgi:hypothetical protein
MKYIRLMRIPDEIMIELLTGKARLQLPEGTTLLGSWRDIERDGMTLKIENPRFAGVREGEQIPALKLIVERWTALPD